MNYQVVLFLFLLSSASLFGQYYNVDCFQGEYDETIEFTSVYDMTEGYYDEFTLDFGFGFPFESDMYSDITFVGASAYVLGDDSPDFNFILYDFIYEVEDEPDPSLREEDIGYAYVERNGLSALVIEFKKNRLANDPSIDEFDSGVTMQHWFYENGMVELHFGDINVLNSPAYIHGEGFVLLPQEINLGPSVEIRSAKTLGLDLENVSGPYDDWVTIEVNEGSGRLNTAPPKGWVINFEKVISATDDHVNLSSMINLHPNPTSGELTVEFPDILSGRLSVRDVTGQVLFMQEIDVTDNISIDLYGYEAGMYLVEVVSDDGERYVERVVIY